MVEEGIGSVVGGGLLLALTRTLKDRHQRRRFSRGHEAALSGTLHGPGIPKFSLNTKIVIAAQTLTGMEQIFGGGGARYEVPRSQIRNVNFDVINPADESVRPLFTEAMTFETSAGRFTLTYDPLWDRLLRAAFADV